MIIYVITHKNVDLKLPEFYRILMVGAYNKEQVPVNFLRDDDGDNISSKNNSYCELTGLYWIWKNTNDDIIGLVHYRRFFVKLGKCISIKNHNIFLSKKNAYRLLQKDEIIEILDEYDTIVKQSRISYSINNKTDFVNLLGTEIWDNLTAVISEKWPDYLNIFKEEEKKRTHFNCNMFIGHKEIIDKYCSWLFDVLERIDNKHYISQGEYYHKRELGYLAEFLFEVWIRKNGVKFKVIPAVNVEDKEEIMNIPEFLSFSVQHFKNRLIDSKTGK